MCGIVALYPTGETHKDNPKELILKLFSEQKTRGVNGFGLGLLQPDGSLLRDRTMDEAEIVKSNLWGKILPNSVVLFHHRNPTSSPNLPTCNHPLMNESCTMMVVHNGMISSPWEKLPKGHEVESLVETLYRVKENGKTQLWDTSEKRFTDSEVILHLIEENKEGVVAGLIKNKPALNSDFILVVEKGSPNLYFCATSRAAYITRRDGWVVLHQDPVGKEQFTGIGLIKPGGIVEVVEKETPIHYVSEYCGGYTNPQTGWAEGYVWDATERKFVKPPSTPPSTPPSSTVSPYSWYYLHLRASVYGVTHGEALGVLKSAAEGMALHTLELLCDSQEDGERRSPTINILEGKIDGKEVTQELKKSLSTLLDDTLDEEATSPGATDQEQLDALDLLGY